MSIFQLIRNRKLWFVCVFIGDGQVFWGSRELLGEVPEHRWGKFISKHLQYSKDTRWFVLYVVP